MTSVAAPVRACRRRGLSTVTLLSCSLLLASPALASGPEAIASCSTTGAGWCRARRIAGSAARGELGFRFGEPLDVDGDGQADIAAGARFTLQQETLQNGSAAVWSGANGALIRAWDGEWPGALFGHWVMPVPDLSGDGLADVIVAAPLAPVGGRARGVLVARSPQTGEEIWRRTEAESESLGWDLTLAGDHDGDGRVDLFAGAPAGESGRVYLLSGKDGSVLQTYTPRERGGSFGWYVAGLEDLDGDGRADLAVGAPTALAADGALVGEVRVFSSASGRELYHWEETDGRKGFGGVLAAVADLDGDGKGEIAVGAPGTEDLTRRTTGEVRIYSGGTGKELRRWSGSQPGELYGRMVIGAGDLDGDGIEDLAIGAPWYRRDTADRIGRVELRSGRTSAVLGEWLGDEAECWFGWHIRRAPDPEGRGRPVLLVSSLRHPVDGKVSVGVLDLYVLRGSKDVDAQGTIRRDARRSDIR